MTLCEGGVLQGQAVANIYNNGGLVPATHYSKAGVSPCYGFHASFPGNRKINNKGNYQLSGAHPVTEGGHLRRPRVRWSATASRRRGSTAAITSCGTRTGVAGRSPCTAPATCPRAPRAAF
ncbi:hypothetical protein FAIPA1_230023 [Frankia sp. AiPs1]